MTIKNAHVKKFKDAEWLLQVLPDGITGRVAFDSMGDRIYAEYQVHKYLPTPGLMGSCIQNHTFIVGIYTMK